ncbi:PREDICTED: uncharacterized protein LOC105969235 [Erythranthe guttata]|uniref:uncharacterized protein LOC105969235 n=1 Tax=Erythranthe guttata TaxID=4155 RepID=UPI00064DFAA9|nr:PREDICTED: uncharacterized protein LOC105969235 [Erythranthe guttata]|eukprot:XP_012849439.1 PREDICTED: uncharacterized protein LOC105969235 [Erythranthe guttata]
MGMVIIIAGWSDGEKRRRRLYMIVGCEHGGLYAGRKVLGEDDQRPGKRSTGSKKCNYPFKLKERKEGNEDEHVEWKLDVHSGIHNHNLFENLQGHSYIDFNELSGRSQLQLLFAKLKEDKYLSYHRSNEFNEIADLLWIHPKCIKLAQPNPYVFVMDCTYKTNGYGLPFLEIVGFTCTNLTFAIAFPYMDHKKMEISNGRCVVWWRP